MSTYIYIYIIYIFAGIGIVINVAGCLIRGRRRWSVTYTSPRGLRISEFFRIWNRRAFQKKKPYQFPGWTKNSPYHCPGRARTHDLPCTQTSLQAMSPTPYLFGHREAVYLVPRNRSHHTCATGGVRSRTAHFGLHQNSMGKTTLSILTGSGRGVGTHSTSASESSAWSGSGAGLSSLRGR